MKQRTDFMRNWSVHSISSLSKLPYANFGSLEGKIFSEQQLKMRVCTKLVMIMGLE
jgi:hypothetical protein